MNNLKRQHVYWNFICMKNHFCHKSNEFFICNVCFFLTSCHLCLTTITISMIFFYLIFVLSDKKTYSLRRGVSSKKLLILIFASALIRTVKCIVPDRSGGSFIFNTFNSYFIWFKNCMQFMKSQVSKKLNFTLL